MAANKIQVGYIEAQDGAQFQVDAGTAAAPGLCFDNSAATGLYSPGTGQIAWSTSGKQTALRILADGKVGIDCSPTVALEVNGTIKASAINAPIEGTLDDWIVHEGDANTKIGFSANDTFQVHTSGTPHLQVSSNGRVLIGDAGTYSPSGDLHIVGDTNSNGPELYLVVNNNNTTDNIGALWFGNNGDKTLVKLAGHTHTATNTADFTVSTTSGGTTAERLRIKSDGNILQTKTGANVSLTLSRNESVGTTNQALAVIDFASNTAHTVQARLMAKSLGTSNVGGDLVVECRADGGSLDERLRITGSGDVGIGYNSPTVKLHVREGASGASSYDNRYHMICENNGEAYLGFYVPNNQYAGIRFSDTTGLEGYLDYYFGTDEMVYSSTSAHYFKTAGTERLRIDSSGRLLLGAGAVSLPKGSAAGSFDLDNGNITMCIGGNSNSTGRTNSTDKINRVTSPHYTNAEEPVAIYSSYNVSNQNIISYGGGSGQTNAVTKHSFYTAANTTTTTGTERLQIDSSGRVMIGDTDTDNAVTDSDNLVIGAASGDNGMTIVSQSGNYNGSIRFSDGANTGDNAIRGTIQYYHGQNYMRFYTNATEKLRITDGGQVRLPINGQQLTWGASQQMKFYYENSEDRMYLQGDGAYGMAFRVNGGNRLEINKTTGDITMQGASGRNFQWDNSDASLQLTDNGSGASARLKIGTGGDLQMYHDVGGQNHITCATNQELKISSNGLTVYEYSGVTKKFQVECGSTNRVFITDRGGGSIYPLISQKGTANHPDITTNNYTNLSSGTWYTIAVNPGNRATGRFIIMDRSSSRHTSFTFYAGHNYGGANSQNGLNLIHSAGTHGTQVFGGIRIKGGGTYDGCALQVYMQSGTNHVTATCAGDQLQNSGWIMKEWINDNTDPGGTGNWSSLGTVSSYIYTPDMAGGGMSCDGALIPGFNDYFDLGTSNRVWDDIYASNTTIQTSDITLKQDIASLTSAEMNAAKRLSTIFKTYRWKDKVTKKGDAARTHTGVIAQTIKTEMEAAGLDPEKYAFYCKNVQYFMPDGTQVEAEEVNPPTAETVPDDYSPTYKKPDGATEKTIYSVRYVELLAFLAAYNEQRFTSIESRLTALEGS